MTARTLDKWDLVSIVRSTYRIVHIELKRLRALPSTKIAISSKNVPSSTEPEDSSPHQNYRE